jgi:hypothetical protein
MADLKSASTRIPASNAGVALAAMANHSGSLLDKAYLARVRVLASPFELR